ncbi:hypothetical protein, partial [Alkalicoccus saliphilus]
MNDESRRCKFKQKIRSSFPLLFTSHAEAELLRTSGKELNFYGGFQWRKQKGIFLKRTKSDQRPVSVRPPNSGHVLTHSPWVCLFRFFVIKPIVLAGEDDLPWFVDE